MEGGSDEATVKNTKTTPEEGGESKSKRKMKTAAQLEVLETTYAAEPYPSEAIRADLSVKLNLSDRQLQMWFCHRRLKDRKSTTTTPSSKRQRKELITTPMAVESPKPAVNAADLVAGNEFDSRRAARVSGGSGSGVVTVVRRFNEPSSAEVRAVGYMEAQLGERLRDNGPILGMEFDPLPPGAFGMPIEMPSHRKASRQAFETSLYVRSDVKPNKDVRPIREYQFLPDLPSSRTDHSERVSPSHHYGVPLDASVMRGSVVSAGHRDDYKISPQIPNLNLATRQGKPGHVYSPNLPEYDSPYQKSYMDTPAQRNLNDHPIHEDPFVKSEREVGNEDEDDDALQLERKRKNEEARISRELEAHEKRIRRELEKQDMLRRKREEQLRKEMERQDRERRKEEERLLRERQREEERFMKEQMRELQRREKFLKKETMRAEKMRQKEEMRREKEVARLKAANERAIARKIAKESMELIEDERLELMEVAALTKGLPSMLALDFETLQNLDEYRDKQVLFPPSSVKLKKPFTVKPWNGSDENVANLLMVWRFLITFADVFGLWPFTLDEFAQAFHDYDPRLMGEIHIVLLKTIIKDIEGVTRTLLTGVGANQNTASNPGGGHPHVVEGAYAWGFDIRSWRRNLNVFTWPEILRQLALSAGLGPQLKKRNIKTVSVHDENEANDSENVIFNLRKGVAAENAFAKMQERGLSNPKRSRHRLTPGTVKFAAFHVLSLEGEKGLTILDVAEKIQKSGLRDLTTSRTPEASVAAALSRDTKLFERVAPSTYCVRASYRKEAGGAETILAEARERIRAFKSGITDVEDVDDADRDEDSESDVGDDPEMDLNPKKEDPDALDIENSVKVESVLENGKTKAGLPLTPSLPEDIKDEKRDDILVDQSLEDAVANDADSACFDESKLGEQWVQGLVEGDYSNLSSEERLNALVALIGIAIEGNTIRVALEERLEVASALKKQMWGEVQLDKRWKEESLLRANYLSYPTAKPGLNSSTPASGNQENSSADVTPISSQDPLGLPQMDVNNVIAGPSLQLQDNVSGMENLQYQQQGGYTADRERLRAQLKAYVGYKAEELYVYRSLPLGQDRRRNRYWRFSASASRNDPGCGRIFVELQDGRWRLIDSEEDFDYLVKSLDVRGVRESHLHFMLLKIEASFKEAVRKNVEANPGLCSVSSSLDFDTAEISTTFKIELGDSNAIERCSVLQRFQSFEKWMWDNMLHPGALSAFKYGAKQSSPLFRICRTCAELHLVEDICCPSCGQMRASPDVGELCFADQVAQLGDYSRGGDTGFILRSSISSPLRIRLLKIQLALVEASLPPEGLEAFWTENHRKSWGLKLLSSSSPEELNQVLTTLEVALKRDFLSSNFETTSELLGLPEEALASDSTCVVNVLPWIPKTTGGVALRLFEFDSAIVYTPDQNNDPLKDKESEDLVGLETNLLRNVPEKDVMETPVQGGYTQEDNWIDPGVGGVSSSGRGGRPARGRGRPRSRGSGGNGKKPAVSVSSSRPPRGAANTNGETMLRPRAQPRSKKNGRRSSTKGRKRPTKGTLGISNEVVGGRLAKEVAVTARTTLPDNEDDWIETPELQDDDGEASSSGRSFQYKDYDDDEVMAPMDDFDDAGESSKLVGRGEFSLHSDVEYEEEEEDEEEEEEEDMNTKMDVNYINDDSFGRREQPEISNDAARKRFMFDDPDLTSSSSSDYR
ncbi:PREDICTED: homeobox-DDT domain protein RLT2-like [Camelina sativa]|uniref:Homeobox-DDT domain protein RLT2-like n=1 Tax=Camelina sativa TaxID=90675 RepID=A0ABM0X787_CAMSA|nr:PREDICTED: homeobox-DDT domain protein RLT2-like [Camelina sativa]